MNELELTELFRKLGARNPEGWARSQVEENIPQLARYLFLRQAWKLVVDQNSVNWISNEQNSKRNSPGGTIVDSLERILEAGVRKEDITTVVRTMQWKLLAGICQLLEDPGNLEAEVKDVAWRLFQVDERDNPMVAIPGLLESLLETEPNGREMRSG